MKRPTPKVRDRRAGTGPKKRRRPVRLRRRLTGIPDDVARRLVDRDDEYHLEPEGRVWLAKALAELRLLDPLPRRRRRSG